MAYTSTNLAECQKSLVSHTFFWLLFLSADSTTQTASTASHRFFATNNNKTKELIIHAVASNRVGIVSDLTKYVTEMGGSVGESQASRLGSHFSIMMLVHNVPENQVDALGDQLKNVENISVSIHLVQSKGEAPISHSEIGCK